MKRTRCTRRIFQLLALSLATSFCLGFMGCQKRSPLPEALFRQSEIPGIPGARTWAFSDDHAALRLDLAESVRQEMQFQPSGYIDPQGYFNILALSGGGANGAFGAGLLCGWSAAGGRPIFKIVTGISTGALMAPFAFLGPAKDAQLQEVYTSVATRDLVALRPRLITHGRIDSLADTSKLERLIAKYFDDPFIGEVARAHALGRRLFIGTTDLDANRLAVWNMGAIAAADRPEACDLFRKVLLASAAIPILFPPVYFEVEAGGAAYDEMHVDGGIVRQVFVHRPLLQLAQAALDAGYAPYGSGRLYIIQNLPGEAPYTPVPSDILSISQHAILDLFANQGTGDLYHIYTLARDEGTDYNIVAIPPSFIPRSRELFDPEDMQRLFDLGYGMAAGGIAWSKSPPGYRE